MVTRQQQKQKCIRNEIRFVFNITYPVFLILKNLLSEIHLLLISDRAQGKISNKIPTTEFRRAKSFERHSCES